MRHIIMSFALAPGISFVEQDGDRVFLDLNRDRYFALGEPSNSAFTALTHGKPDHQQTVHLQKLVEDQLLVDVPYGDNPRPCRQPHISASALDTAAAARGSIVQMLLASWSIADAKRRLRTRSLAFNVRRLEHLKAMTARDVRRPGEGEREAIAAAFRAAGRMIATLDQCLALSFAMARHCLKRGLDTQFSIGVKLRPFEAHAWVSVEGTVVSDRLDNVRPFTTILLI
jgi:hypothetical protein